MIPLIDLHSYNNHVAEESVQTSTLEVLAEQICQAFQEVGFVYLKNHGIPRELIAEALSTSKTFFHQPTEKKQLYALKRGQFYGWIAFEEERVNHNRPVFDAREGFTMGVRKDKTLPEKLPPEVDSAWRELYTSCSHLALRLLDLLSIGLGKNRGYLRQCHKKLGLDDNVSMIRSNYYPPLKEIKPEQARCGEHSDYGTITFLFQDEVSGLQAKIQGGDYVPVNPIEDTIVMNLGDMMQRWSADRLKATKHRVMASPTDVYQTRQSIAFFVVPDDDALISCTDGSNKYPDITCGDYVKSNFSANFLDDTEI